MKTKTLSPSSKVGQLIGEIFEKVVINFITQYIEVYHPDYQILSPKEGKKLLTMPMMGGSMRQLDTVLVPKNSHDPVALLETKWLKDARHWNDKGAWILQLREVKKKHATIRGAAAILAGYWTEGVGIMLESEGGIKMVLIATDEEVYQTFQQPLDKYFGSKSFKLDAPTMRKSYIQAEDLESFMNHLVSQEQLPKIAETWLQFERKRDEHNNPQTGADLIKMSINELLTPLPKSPRVTKFEISLQIETGNIVYQEFEDMEELFKFIQTHSQNPDELLKLITPKKHSK